MKRILFTLLFVVCFAASALAEQWCQWDGIKGINCQSDSREYIIIAGAKVKTPAIANENGWYKRVDTPATITSTQAIDAEIWSFANDEIGLTWSVRDLGDTEILERDSAAMQLQIYEIWRVLFWKGVLTEQEAVDVLPTERKDAYLARKAIEDAQ